jgi:predicted GNAT family acetyltransferase
MRAERFDDVERFMDAAGGFLAAREAEHNLLLGICSTLSEGGSYGEEPPYFCVVRGDGDVVGAALRTPRFNVALSEIDDLDAVALIVRDVAEVYPDLPGVLAPTEVARRFAALWAERKGVTPSLSMNERIFRCDSVRAPEGVPGRVRPVEPRDRALVLRWFAEFEREAVPPEETRDEDESTRRRATERAFERFMSAREGGVYLWEVDGEPVSLTGCGGRTPHGIRIAPVYTPPERRRRGYAGALVAAVTQQQLDRGLRFCFLFTNLANPTSNSVYMRIGYEPVTDVDLYTFR